MMMMMIMIGNNTNNDNTYSNDIDNDKTIIALTSI